MTTETILLIAAALVIIGQWVYINWVGNNTDSLAKLIRKQADVIYKGQGIINAYQLREKALRERNEEFFKHAELLQAGLLQTLREISAADWDFPGMDELKKLVHYESSKKSL
jgi:hypothetical protein